MKEIKIISTVPINNCALCNDEFQVCLQFFLNVIAIGLATFIIIYYIGGQK